jgi:hypothetical protein
MQVKDLYIISFAFGPGTPAHPKESAKGLFYKYSDRPGTDSVTWYKILNAQGEHEKVAEWKRDDPGKWADLRDDDILRPEGTAPASIPKKSTAGEAGAGAYVVAHAKENTVADLSARAIAEILKKLKLPPLRKIAFVACHAAEVDEKAKKDPRSLDIKLAGHADTADAWVHGLETQDLSFLSQFCCCYAETLANPKQVMVAGWESFVSVAHTEKVHKTMPKEFNLDPSKPGNYDPSKIGKKFILSGDYKFPSKSSHYKPKKMFCWTVQGNKQSTVTKIKRADWSDRPGT